jgi:hypothetical protein
MLNDVQTLDGYLSTFGPLLGKQAERSLSPLWVPGEKQLPQRKFLRQPFEAQAHVIQATAIALKRQKAVLIVGECGTGKTIQGMCAAHAHANGRPYRALVFCPGQLVKKWQREIEETIPDASVTTIESWVDVLRIRQEERAADGFWHTPTGPNWVLIARDRAKLGCRWKPAFNKRTREEAVRCPTCGQRVCGDNDELLGAEDLSKRRMVCKAVLLEGGVRGDGCGAPLWQCTDEIKRYEPAKLIHKRLRGFFDYLILDEVHEEKGANTAQGNAAGCLAAACRRVIALTGTLIGGYSEHLRPLLFRLAPRSLVNEGLGWSDSMRFNELYGRIETRITEKEGGGGDNRESRGSSRTKTKSVRPGVMPTLFGRHLLDKAVFLGLSEVAQNLPNLSEECIAVDMDDETAAEYEMIERELTAAIKQMVVRGDRRLLGAMLQTLLAYPDYPFHWEPVGYCEKSAFITVTVPKNLDPGPIRPKERQLVDMVMLEACLGRQVWVFVQMTDKYDVQARLQGLLEKQGLRVQSLRAAVPLAKREEWIAKNAPGCHVIISHPRLVETGLDLFDKGGRHNFSTLIFYETGYNLFTLRQASRRSWRIGQQKECKVQYLYYDKTLQARALALMGRKMSAAQALEGKFSSDGLVAMSGEDGGSVEMALARSLAGRLDEGDARRAWQRLADQAKAAIVPFRRSIVKADQVAKLKSVDFGALRRKLAVSVRRTAI